MSGSSNLDSFHDGRLVAIQLVLFWNVAFRTSSKLLATFLCSFFSSCLVSFHVVHLHSSIETTAAWKKLRFILSVRSDFDMTSIWPIAYRLLSMPSLAACRCPFRLMRHCFLGRWTFLLESESYCLMWKCLLFECALTWRSIPTATRSRVCSFCLSGCIC